MRLQIKVGEGWVTGDGLPHMVGISVAVQLGQHCHLPDLLTAVPPAVDAGIGPGARQSPIPSSLPLLLNLPGSNLPM